MMLEKALQYLKDGYSVIPIRTKSKTPHVKWQDFATRRATEDEVRQWFSTWPNANIGIVTGKVSGLVVLDVDPRHGGDAKKVYDLAPTGLIVKTGTGGAHLFYRYPDGVANISNRVGLLPGVDVRGDAGYVVAAPSLHENGRNYEWMRTEHPADLPSEMLNAVLTGEYAPKHSTPAGDDGWIATLMKGSPSGARNDSCAKLCGYFVKKGLPKDIVLQMLLQWNEKNQPPLPHGEVEACMESVFRTAARKAGEQNQPKPFSLVGLDDYMRLHGSSEIEWTVKDWLPKDTVAFAVAPPGTYKTWLLLDIAASVATGTKFLGEFPVTEQGPVIVIQQEDFHGSIAERMGIILQSKVNFGFQETSDGTFEFILPPKMMPIHIHPDRMLKFADPKVMAELEKRIIEIRPKLVIIDPLYSAGGTEDFMAKAAEQMLILKRYRDQYKCSFIVAHHTKKRSEDTVREDLWGSQFLNALLETGWQIRKDLKGGPASIRLHRHFKVTGAVPDVSVEFSISSNPPYSYAPRTTLVNEESGDDLALQIVNEIMAKGPLTVPELCEILETTSNKVKRRVTMMEKDGVLAKAPGGRWTVGAEKPDM